MPAGIEEPEIKFCYRLFIVNMSLNCKGKSIENFASKYAEI